MRNIITKHRSLIFNFKFPKHTLLIFLLSITSITTTYSQSQSKKTNSVTIGSHDHLINKSITRGHTEDLSNKFLATSLSLDPNNTSGAGGTDINTISCSSGYEILDNNNTGVVPQFISTDGVQSITITLSNPQDMGDESLSIGGTFPGVLVSGNGTTQLTLTNDGFASINQMANALDDLTFVDAATTPNVAITREVDIYFTSYTSEQSNTATAFFNVVRASNSGINSGATIVFNTDAAFNIFTTLDGSQDSGGTWTDVDGTGALTGDMVDPTGLPLGGSIFTYTVSSNSPCQAATTSIVVINLNSSEVPISAPTSCGTFITNYTNPLFSANSNDPIYTFDSGITSGEIEAEAGAPGTTYLWYKYDAPSNSYLPFANNTTRIQSNLADGGYLVVKNEAGTITEGRVWVWNTSTSPDAGPDNFVCTGGEITLSGNTTITNPIFTYYDPIERPFIIDANTQISITFDALHTFVSDLAFYAINPSGDTRIELGPRQAGTGNCNGGDNVSGLTFTSIAVGNAYDYCSLAVPLSGTFNSFDNGPATQTIDWSPWYGENARSGGWAVQIYDCVGQDVGFLTNAIVEFNDGAGNVVTYSSGVINVAINDNSCTPESASIYIVPSMAPVSNNESVSINDGVGIGGSGGYEWSYSTDGVNGPWSAAFENSTLTPMVSINQEAWFRLRIDNSTPCVGEDVVHVSVENQPFAGYGLGSSVSSADGIINLFDQLVDEGTGGTWSVINGNPGASFNSTNGTFDASTAPEGSYTFRYTVTPNAPCLNTDQEDVILLLSNIDSDNDGVPDNVDPAPMNSCIPNPLAIGLGDCDGDGTLNQDETDATAAMDPCDPLNLSNDPDNDLICNLFDLDDDNDGIPDTEEDMVVCQASTLSTFNYIDHWSVDDDPVLVAPNPALQYGDISLSLSRSDPDGILTDTRIRGLFNNLQNTYVVKQNSVSVAQGKVSFHEWNFSEPVDNLDFEVFDIDDGGGWEDNVKIRGYNNGVEYIIQAADVVLGATVNYAGNNSFIGTANINAYPQSSARITFPVQIDKIVVEFSNVQAVGFNTQIIGFKWGVSWCSLDNDFDGDGIANSLDLDSDNDGIPDIIEAGGVDADGDGMVDNPVDANQDGLDDNIAANPLPIPNTDGTGNANFLDIDADDDGIVDNIEGQTTAAYQGPSGNYGTNGWDANYEGIYIVANTDNADMPDYLDLDSDNDGDPDLTEGWDTNNNGSPNTTPTGVDADNDGLDDGFDNNTALVNPTNGQTPSSFPNMDAPGTTELDWREETPIVPPTATDDQASMNEDAPTLSINVMVNDMAGDFPLDPNSVNIITNPTNGTVVVNADGSINYTPNPNFNGTETFVYEICDNQNPPNCDQATVSITVNPINDVPVANDDNAVVDEDDQVIISVLGNDNDNNDPNGNIDPSSVTITGNPTNGTVVVNADGTITYTPNPNYNGLDSFTYQVCDDGNPVPALCAEATVSVVVNSVNDAPIAIDDNGATQEGAPVTTTVLGNDTDSDGIINPATVTIDADPTNGTVVVNVDGTITYTPNAGFVGTDTYTYQVCDDGMPVLCDTADVVITVSAGAPVATDDQDSVDEDGNVTINILGNDSDPDGSLDPSSLTIITDPANGTVVINNGTVTYTPNPNFNGTDTFVYQICDDGTPTLCDQATVTITVNPINDDPVANDDNAVVDEDGQVTIPVLGNDNDNIDPNGNIDPSSVTVTSNPTNGTVIVNVDGTISYTPNPDFNGLDSFTYQVCDDGNPLPALCTEATVTVVVNPVNDAPIAVDDNDGTQESVPVTTTVLGNDSDSDGVIDPTTVTIITNPNNGTVIVNNDGTITYVPNAGFAGTDTYTYQVCDDGNPVLCDTADVVITVSAGAPIATDDQDSVDEDGNVTINILNNDSDPDGAIDPSSVTITTDPVNGTVVVNADGTVTYTPNADFNGTDTFVYQVCDDSTPALCDNATVTVTVNPVNDEPLIVDDNVTTDEDTPVNILLLASDSDPLDPLGNIDPATISITTNPVNGTVVINGDGTVTYTPNPEFSGTDSFVYQVCDDGNPLPALCGEATVNIIIDNINDGPVVVDDQDATSIGNPTTTSVLDNDSDVDGVIDPNSVTIITDPTNGTVTVNADGTITYTPAAGFIGEDSYEYQVCDDGMPVLCDQAIVTITVLDCDVNDPDLDCDNDGATNGDEDAAGTDPSNPDTDGDGILDGAENNLVEALDPCSDPNLAGWMEQDTNDCDNDGMTVGDGDPDDNDDCNPNVLANPFGDCDNDGATNGDEDAAGTDPTNPDTDGDGILDGAENDLVEALDPCADPSIAGWTEQDTNDCDGDGVTVGDGDPDDLDACNPDPLAIGDGDCDGDGTLNEDEVDAEAALDPCLPNVLAVLTGDCDNDGATNGDEDAAGTDPTNPDTDGDGILDGAENDLVEALDPCADPSIAGWTEQDTNDCDGDGVTVGDGDPDDFDICVPDISFCPDNDGDGIPDSVDLDDDNDGISDLEEGGGDTDGDGIPDWFDLDSDNDGIPDILEAGGIDTNNDGLVDEINDDGTLINDADNDGWADNEQLNPMDTDGDGHDDYQDLDADNDGIPDIIEAGGVDGNGNGLVDEINDDLTLINDANGDGWADNEQLVPMDSDGDGHDDYQDLDSDNDSISDIIESGNEDPDGDGMVDVNNDNTLVSDDDNDGWDVDHGVIDPIDSDGDGVQDYLDLDSDNDGFTDIFENGNGDLDTDNDGMVDEDLFVDDDNNGWMDNLNTVVDTDNDGIPNYLDPDSDGDGINDGNGTDFDGLADCDNDNLIDYLDPDPCELSIPDAFSPNGDGFNDLFIIRGIEAYPNNTLVIFNRWGNKVYEANPYHNTWNGDSEFGIILGEKELPDGTYFYILELGANEDPIKGFIYLKR